MPTYPWRFQADLTADNPDPDVTVFVGDTITNEVTGETKVHQDTNNPEIVPLSELSTYVTTAMTSGVTRTSKTAPGMEPTRNEPTRNVPTRGGDDDDEDDKPQSRPSTPPKPTQRPASKPMPTGGQRR